MAEGKGILSAAKDRLKGTGYVKETPVAAPAVAGVRLPDLALPTPTGARKCRPGFTWNEEKRACVKDTKKGKKRKPRLPKLPKLPKGAKGAAAHKAVAEQIGKQFGIDPNGEQAQMLADQEMGSAEDGYFNPMWDSLSERNDFFNTYDPNGPYGISDGFNYATDSWVNDPWTDTSSGFGNTWSGADADNYSGWGSQGEFEEDFGADSYWGGDSDDSWSGGGYGDDSDDGGAGWSSDFNEGGTVYRNHGGFGGHAKGTDTVPAMLSEGEFVIDADSARQFPDEIKKINDWEPTEGGFDEVIRDLDELINAKAFGRNPKGV